MTHLVNDTRSREPARANAEEVALAVRAYIAKIRTEGSVWSSDAKTAVLRSLRGKRPWQLFGESAITAAASPTVHACCRFGLARLLATKLDEPGPTVSPATVALLGQPCAGCVREIDDEAAARDVAAGRSARSRPTATTSAVTASGTSFRPGGPRSPSGWEQVPDRVPTPEEDEAFLAAMARVQPRRVR